MNSTNCVSRSLESELGKPHYFGTLPLVRKAPAEPAEATFPDNENEMLDDQRTAVRSDVVRMLARYVLLSGDSAMRSVAGRIAIDESRVTRKRVDGIDLDGLTAVQGLDAIRAAMIRKAVFAAPEKRTDMRHADGEIMRCVAPTRAVAAVVRTHSTRSSGSGSNARDFTSTVAMKLARLPKASAEVVVRVEQIKLDRVILRNQLSHARSAYKRLNGGGKSTKRFRERVGRVVADLEKKERQHTADLQSKVHTAEYRDGLTLLAIFCTESAEVEAICFGNKNRIPLS